MGFKAFFFVFLFPKTAIIAVKEALIVSPLSELPVSKCQTKNSIFSLRYIGNKSKNYF